MQSDTTGIKKFFYWVVFLLACNLLLMGGVVCYVLLKTASATPASAISAPVQSVKGPAASTVQLPTQNSEPEEPTEDPADPSAIIRKIALSPVTKEALDQAMSLEMAERLYEAKEYFKACYIYDRLKESIIGNTVADECLKDYLHLQMALCLQKTQEQELMGELFTRALQSRSPVVRALANYNLAFIEMHNQQYLAARRRAYRALGLMETLKDTIPGHMETDTYFLAAEALSRYLLRLHDVQEFFAGQSWSEQTPLIQIPLFDPQTLKEFLVAGIEEVNAASLSPVLRRDQNRQEGIQWFAVCMDAPLEEVLWKYASDTDIHLAWADLDVDTRRRAVTMYLPYVAGAYVAEVASGSAGLVWRYDGQRAVLYDPQVYTDFERHKAVLVQETIATWQRFLLRFREDSRTSNAHYLLGMMYSLADQKATALGEYKLLASQFPNDSLAPFALLQASRLKVDLKDYEGARRDLNELLMQYPECQVVDEATLYLADATMHSGAYNQAADLYEKIYQFHLKPQSRLRSCYGMGQCAYLQNNHIRAVEWLGQAVKMTEDPDDPRLGPALFQIGKSCIALEEYAQASAALKAALKGQLATREHVEVTLELIEAEMRQEHFLQALEIMEQIDSSRLNQELSCRVILVRARLLQEMDLIEAAISLLRRRIEFIAESTLRARLSVELARCYAAAGDYQIAEKELSEAIYDLEDPDPTRAAAMLLARTVYTLGNLDRALQISSQIVINSPQGHPLRKEAFDLIGQICTDREEYEQAALAYAGLWNQESESL